MLVTKIFTTVTNILELSPKHFVSNIARKMPKQKLLRWNFARKKQFGMSCGKITISEKDESLVSFTHKRNVIYEFSNWVWRITKEVFCIQVTWNCHRNIELGNLECFGEWLLKIPLHYCSKCRNSLWMFYRFNNQNNGKP